MTALAWLLVAAVAFPLGVFVVELLAGILPARGRASSGSGPSVAVLIPAHDESAGIGATLAALAQVAPPGTRALVVADNCQDDTAAQARAAGAEVIERQDASARGKGYALAFGRDHLARGPAVPDVVVVLDADCRLSPGSIEALAQIAAAEGRPAQAINLIAEDLSAPPMVQIGSFAMLVKNLYRSRGMQRLGGPALLTGTGMAFPWALIARAELATGSIVEDLALGIELTRAGHPPRLVESAGVRSAPADMRDALTQRTRWEHGFLETVRGRALPLLASGLKRGSRAEVLLALHLLVPPLALLLMLAGAALGGAAVLALAGGSVVPALVLAGLLGLALLLVLAAWVAGGRAYLSGGALLRAPLYVLWKLPVYAGFLRKRKVGWTRTPRRP
ncbi:MAG: hypothetical protein B7Z08_00275 [Sphingomonadales bacterium 32-68-7]|nr:MAG: hypothetical protein B7Z33_09300 [Sphingomonadales bacterium 12-68-11]OYX10600.1 MAG: hypothetical protein B7Z08_00275 [Sphingomonadales bacterium 32-68-7]